MYRNRFIYLVLPIIFCPSLYVGACVCLFVYVCVCVCVCDSAYVNSIKWVTSTPFIAKWINLASRGRNVVDLFSSCV